MPNRQQFLNLLPLLSCYLVLAVLQVPGLFWGHLTWDERISEYIPWRVEAARLLAGGEFPFFTDKVFGGMPLFATAYVGVLYPPNWSYILFPATVANWLEVFHGFLGAVGMFLYLRHHRLSRPAAFLGGGFFLLLLFHGIHGSHVSMREAGMLAPFVALAGARLIKCPTAGRAALLSGLIALQWFVGYAQLVLFTFLWLGMDWLLRFRPNRKFLLTTLLFGGSILLGTCLAMVQIQPAMALVGDSARQQMTMESWQAGSFPPHLMTLLVQPLFLDMVGDQWDGVNYSGEWVTTPLPVVVMLAVVPFVAMVRSRRFVYNPRGRMVLLYGGGALFTLLLALGSYFPLNQFLFHVPPFNLFRIPSRWFFLFGVFVVILAAVAIDWMGRMGVGEKYKVLSLSFLAFLIFALLPWVFVPLPEDTNRQILPGFWGLFLQGEHPVVLRVGARLANIGLPDFHGLLDRREWALILLLLVPVLLSVRRSLLAGVAPVVLLLLSLQWFQVMSAHVHWPSDQSAAITPGRHPLLNQVDKEEITRIYSPSPDGHTPGFYALLQNTHLFHGVRGLQGYCPLLSDRMIFSFNISQSGHGWRDHDVYKSPAMPQSAGVSHLIIQTGRLTGENRRNWEEHSPHHYEVVATHEDYLLVRLREPVPRYHLARMWSPIAAQWEAEEDIWSPDHLPVSKALLRVENPPWRLMPPPDEPLGEGSVTIRQKRTSRVILEVESDGPGVLVIRDIFWPGWRWRVLDEDGAGGWNRVQRAQSALRYLPVPDGQSVIEVKYSAPKFRQGLTVSLVSLIPLLGLMLIGRFRVIDRWVARRNRSGSPGPGREGA